MVPALRLHWPEYLMEAWGLGAFMLSASLFGTWLEAPGAFLRRRVACPHRRRALMGLAMTLTALGIFLSPWGRRSGAHLNPAVTLTFLLLGKLPAWDAVFYALFQCLGGLLGVMAARVVAGSALARPPVGWITTVPGPKGIRIALFAELTIAFVMMATVLFSSHSDLLQPATPFLAAFLVGLFIFVEAPLSGMSLNPARTLASALPARDFRGLWVYLIAPFAGMLLAAGVFVSICGRPASPMPTVNPAEGAHCVFTQPSPAGAHP